MERMVSATEARIRLGEWMRRAVGQGEIIIVQRGGKPYAVLLSFEAYQRRKQEKGPMPDDPLANLLALARRWEEERGGRPLTPPPEEVIRQMREERDEQLGLP